MRDVARRAGVSVATVSRVMSGSSAVSHTTHARVRSAIEALDFVPSAAARAINSGRTHMVGALVPTLDNAIFSSFLDALELALAEHGFSLVVATTNSDPEKEAQRAQDLLNLGVEGFIVSGITHSDTFDALIRRYRTPVIATSYFDPESPLVTVGYDNGEAALRALDHLLEMGHTAIAVLSGPTATNDRTRVRVDALRSRRDLALTFHEVPIDFVAAARAVDGLVAQASGTTALLCLSDVIAQGVLAGLQRLGLRVPEQISIVGVDDLPSSQSTWPPLSSVHLPVKRMGTCAAAKLARWIETGEAAAPLKLETEMAARRSVRRLP
ncbi:LacI family DNA-binding transcriptional regulator [Roseobacter sp. WL0113]|uniref:LacI family DNA-binding transcriptional regulator n=2 Tax=Roseobacter sinensis TaxID=2931391 RepID=A0ABT3BF09_9RHOB|nr:LacI family DNA-binding transcriptional regulator [Roseobacter sp. WL0113]